MLRSFFYSVAAGSLFVGGLAATHLAFAQPEEEAGPQGRGGIMAMADANKDGKISKAEMTAAVDAGFRKMDVDGDGQLTQKDRDLRRQQHLETRFAEMDTDRNGAISKAEFIAAHQERADKRAEMRAGRDGPDRGPGGRWRGRLHHGAGMSGPIGEARKDGVVTKAEFTGKAMAMFDRADTNKDGFVTADEMRAARQAMRGARKGPPPPPAD